MESEELAHEPYRYKLTGAFVLPEHWGTAPLKDHLLLVCASGEGKIAIDSERHTLMDRQIFMIPPNQVVRLELAGQQQWEGYGLAYRPYRLTPEMEVCEVSLGFASIKTPAVYTAWERQIISLTEDVDIDAWGRTERERLFWELITDLLKAVHSLSVPTQDQLVQRTIQYMEAHYSQPLNRQLLANMAGMSEDHYAKVFKRTTGKTPLACLNDIRIRQAKQLLVSSGLSYRKIAQQVGISDEFYFSRKFKAVTGQTPSGYAAHLRKTDKVAVLHHHLTGHLLALGMQPYAALINDYYPLGDKWQGTHGIGEYSLDVDRLSSTQPQMIIASDLNDRDTLGKYKLLEQMCPMVIIPFMIHWRAQLHKVATVLGRNKEAAEWLASYDKQARKLSGQLKHYRKQSVLVLGAGDGKLALFGGRNVCDVLYEDLPFVRPEGLEKLSYFQEIDPDALFHYDPDHLLFIPFRNDGKADTLSGVQRLLDQLKEDARWPMLRAVRRDQVYALFDAQHLYTLYTSYSHRLLLDKLAEIFLKDKS